MANWENLVQTRPQISFRRFFFYFITLAAIIVIYLKFSELKLLGDLFVQSNSAWLTAIIIIQIFSYYSLALNYRDVLKVKDLRVSVKELFPITFVIQFINQALPSATLSGQAFFIQYLKRYGLSLAEGISRAIIELLTLYVAFGVFFFTSSILMFQNGVIVSHPEVTFFIYLFLFFGVTFSAIFFALQKNRRGAITKWVVAKLHKYFEKNKKEDQTSHVTMLFDQLKLSVNMGLLGRQKKPFWSAVFWQGMVLFLNIVSLQLISYAIGTSIPFSLAFVAFTLTRFLSMVSFVPGALGIFEGGMTLILISFGVPAQPAFAITLLLRAFTFWFPMPVGWILYRYFLHRQELENPYM